MPLAHPAELDREGISLNQQQNQSLPQPPTFLHVALGYAQLGWHVVPLHHIEGLSCSCGHPDCRIGGPTEKSIAKHPRLPRWQKDATTNPSIITSWWTEWPKSNIGIATGTASNLLVLDIDCHRDKPGFASLQKLETELGPLPRTRTARTGSGGEHRLFLYPQGLAIANSAGWRGAAGIDWRGNGGQIVVSPSVTPAGTYQWTDSSLITELPTTWVDAHAAYEIARRTKHQNIHTKSQITFGDPLTSEDLLVLRNTNEAANADKFRILWEGKWQTTYESQSNADLALCSILAFWCDSDQDSPDPDRIDRIFRHSKLYRDKWERDDYRNRTLLFAVDKEETRRLADKELRELITGQTAPSFSNSVTSSPTYTYNQQPIIPQTTSIDTSAVRVKIRQLVRRKKLSKSVQNKLDGDMIENFIAGEEIISEKEIVNCPPLGKYRGEDGLRRIAYILGKNLPVDIPWEAVILARPQNSRIMYDPQILKNLASIFEQQQKQNKMSQQQSDMKKMKEKQERETKIDQFYKTDRRVKQ